MSTVSFWRQNQSWSASQASANARFYSGASFFGASNSGNQTDIAASAASTLMNSIASVSANYFVEAGILAAKQGTARINAAQAAKNSGPQKLAGDIGNQTTFSSSLAGLVDLYASSPPAAGKFQFLSGTALLNTFTTAMQRLTSNDAVTNAINSAVAGLTSQGDAIDTVTVSGTTFTASTSGANAHDVFSLTWDQTQGAWSSNLIDSIDQHTNAAGEFDLLAKRILAAQGLTSQGDAIGFVSASGNTLTAYTSSTDPHPVFSLTMDQNKGTWLFRLINPIDQQSNNSKTIDLTNLVQKLTQDSATSTYDASSLSGKIKITVSGNEQATVLGTLSDAVDTTAPTPSFGGRFQFVTGDDLNTAFQNAMLAERSNGSLINMVSVIGNTLTASTSGNDAHSVFSITLQPDSGLWTFKLLNPIDGLPIGDDKFVTSFNLSGLMQGVKPTGETVALPSNITVSIHGDQDYASGTATAGVIHQGALTYTPPAKPVVPVTVIQKPAYKPPTNPLTGYAYVSTSSVSGSTTGVNVLV